MFFLIFLISLIYTHNSISNSIDQTCYNPFIYYDFSNEPEEWGESCIFRRNSEKIENGICYAWFKNQGTWGCSQYKGYYPNPSQGYIKYGQLWYNHVECCEYKNVRTVEMLIEINHDNEFRRSNEVFNEDWEIEVYNVQIKGNNGDIKIDDKKGNVEIYPNKYNYDNNKLTDLLYLVAKFDYTDVANKTFDECWEGPSCQMKFELFINGTKVIQSTKFVMDKFYAFQTRNFITGWIREMIEVDYESPSEKVFMTAAWDVLLRDEDIMNLYKKISNRKPEDNICIDTCQIDYSNQLIENVNTSTFGVIMIIVIGFISCFAILLCICFGFTFLKKKQF